ncbi:hypothetical protein AgCh_013904 [Apium graveolens]
MSFPQPSLLSQLCPETPKEVTVSRLKPHLFVEAPQASYAVNFYKAAFGAEEVKRVSQWKVLWGQEPMLTISAHLKLGSTTFVVTDITRYDFQYVLLKSKMRSTFCLETEEIDAAVEKAVMAGAITLGEIAKAGGGRASKVMDPYGYIWMISCSAAAMKRIVNYS